MSTSNSNNNMNHNELDINDLKSNFSNDDMNERSQELTVFVQDMLDKMVRATDDFDEEEGRCVWSRFCRIRESSAFLRSRSPSRYLVHSFLTSMDGHDR